MLSVRIARERALCAFHEACNLGSLYTLMKYTRHTDVICMWRWCVSNGERTKFYAGCASMPARSRACCAHRVVCIGDKYVNIMCRKPNQRRKSACMTDESKRLSCNPQTYTYVVVEAREALNNPLNARRPHLEERQEIANYDCSKFTSRLQLIYMYCIQ